MAKQCADSIVINALHKQFFENECNNMQCSSNTKDAKKPSFEYAGSQWYIECNDDDIPCVIWKSKQNCASTCVHSQALVEYLCNNYDIDDLMLCTEVVVKGTKYWCHPNYHCQGPFYDWFWADFNQSLVPCKLLGVVMPFENQN